MCRGVAVCHLGCWRLLPPAQIARPRVERQPEGIAEGREGPLGGVGFCRLGGKLMGLAGRLGIRFPCPAALPQEALIACPHRDAHPRYIAGGEAQPILLGPDAITGNSLPVPAIKAEDAVGFGDDMPALDTRHKQIAIF